MEAGTATIAFRGGPAGFVGRLRDTPGAPILLALALALASTPIAAIGIAFPTPGQDFERVPPVDVDLVLPMALLAVLVGGLAGGALGGALVRRHPVGGLVVAGMVAWPAALATLPLVPGFVGRPFGDVALCIGSCSVSISGTGPASAVIAYLASFIPGTSGPIELSVVLALIAWVAVDRGRRRLAAALGLGAMVSFNFVSMASAVPAAVALVGGLVLWTAAFWPRSATHLTPGSVAPPG